MDYFVELKGMDLEEWRSGVKRFVFSLERVMAVYFEIESGIKVSEHSHDSEQVGIMLQGRARWRIGEVTKTLEAPALYRIPSNIPHEVEVLGGSKAIFLDVFSPIREDFLQDGPPSYLKE